MIVFIYFYRSCSIGGGVKKATDQVWLVSFMHNDMGFFDNESCRVECAENPFGAKVLPMSPE